MNILSLQGTAYILLPTPVDSNKHVRRWVQLSWVMWHDWAWLAIPGEPCN